MLKEVRFRKLVDTSGKPQIVSLWTDPKRDKRFMKAVKEDRVLTVIQEPRTHRKDFGRLGFHPDPHASYLVFPKPLEVDPGSRVIGITYDLAVESRVTDALPRQATQPPRREKVKPPPEKTFNVILRRTAVLETSLEIKSQNRKRAEKLALERIRIEPFDGSKAVIKNQVQSVEQAKW